MRNVSAWVPDSYQEVKMPTRQEALALLHEHTKSDQLRKHGLAVEAAMRAYARKRGADEETWGMVGILHDFDYEANPDQHPYVGARILREVGWPEEIVEGVLAHAAFTGVSRDTPLKKTIFAVDELTGLITAVALVRPSKSIADVELKSIKKKWKDKLFAAAVNRQEIEHAAESLGVPLDEHIQIVLDAMKGEARALGLN